MASKLSVDAKEFVPVSICNSNTYPAAVARTEAWPRHRDANVRLHADVEEFVPRSAITSHDQSFHTKWNSPHYSESSKSPHNTLRHFNESGNLWHREPRLFNQNGGHSQSSPRTRNELMSQAAKLNNNSNKVRANEKSGVVNYHKEILRVPRVPDNGKQESHQYYQELSRNVHKNKPRKEREQKKPFSATTQNITDLQTSRDAPDCHFKHVYDKNERSKEQINQKKDVRMRNEKSWRDVILSKPETQNATRKFTLSNQDSELKKRNQVCESNIRNLKETQASNHLKWKQVSKETKPSKSRDQRFIHHVGRAKQGSNLNNQAAALPEWRQDSARHKEALGKQHKGQRINFKESRSKDSLSRQREYKKINANRIRFVSAPALTKVKNDLYNGRFVDSDLEMFPCNKTMQHRGWYGNDWTQLCQKEEKEAANDSKFPSKVNVAPGNLPISNKRYLHNPEKRSQGGNPIFNNSEWPCLGTVSESCPLTDPDNNVVGISKSSKAFRSREMIPDVSRNAYNELEQIMPRHTTVNQDPQVKREGEVGKESMGDFEDNCERGAMQETDSTPNGDMNRARQTEWVIVKRKIRNKHNESQKCNNKEEFSDEGRSIAKHQQGGSTDCIKKKQAKLTGDVKNEGKAKNKQSTKKAGKQNKKRRKKENIMYENDQNKIKEFKIMQMLEENLKLDLLELTQNKNITSAPVNHLDKDETGVEEWPTIATPNIVTTPLVSYSEALKKIATPSVTKERGVLFVSKDKLNLTEDEKLELRRKKFKEKRKEKKKRWKERKRAAAENEDGAQNVHAPSGSAIPLDFGSLFNELFKPAKADDTTTTQRLTKQAKISSGVVSTSSGLTKQVKFDKRRKENKGTASVNALDSTQPVRMRGKERETPKKRRPTLLKRVILREREAKRKKREEAEKSKVETTAVKKECITAQSETQLNNQNDEKNPSDSTNTEKDVEREEKDESVQSKISNVHMITPFKDVPKDILSKIHSRKFREYCDHFLSKEVDQLVNQILKDLRRFQTRAYVENPIKAKSKRRLVMGIREVSKHLKTKRFACVIIAPNLERISTEGGIDHMLTCVITQCQEYSIPIVYSMSRQALGSTLKRKVPVSAVGVFSYSGTEDNYKKMMALVDEQREKYTARLSQLMSENSSMEIKLAE